MLLLENRLTTGTFTADRLDAVTLIAGQLAVSIGNARLYLQLEQRGGRAHQRPGNGEPATGRGEPAARLPEPDRPADRPRQSTPVHRALDRAWQHGLDTGTTVGIILLDIDHFKRYNDHYGHLGGDACLRLVAAAPRETARESDLACRYGGEEFAVILPGADAQQSGRIGERFRAAVAGLAKPHALNDPPYVTLSVGAASFVPTPEDHADALIKSADSALYQAKEAGRNRVCIA
jgi:diguanylate cyclase (GGDEF)-like protein